MKRTIVLTVLGVLVLVGRPNAETPTVWPEGCDHATIQAAVDAAAHGDTIAVAPGTYHENVAIDKNLTVHGAGADDCPSVPNPDQSEGEGIGALSPQVTLTNTAPYVRSVVATDLNGDHRLDIVSATSGDHTVAWYPGLGGGVFGARRVVSAVEHGARSVTAADLDADGDVDLAVAAYDDDRISWFRNVDGLGTFDRQSVTGDAPGAHHLVAVDMDGDGDPDLLSAAMYEGVRWYENLGDGIAHDTGKLVWGNVDAGAWAVVAADLDADGDVDVVSASFRSDEIAWHERRSDLPLGWDRHVISNTANGASAVAVADFNGDGSPDVIAGSYLDDTVAWYENDGAGHFGAAQVVSTLADGLRAIHVADLDADGDPDVIAASALSDDVVWYRNDLDGQIWSVSLLSDAASDAESVFAADLDGCGGPDVLWAGPGNHTIAWHRNGGDGVGDACEP